MVESMTLNFYSNDLDREFEIEVDFICREGDSFYQISGVYERELSIERSMDEFCLTDRVKIKSLCQEALEDHYFDEDEKLASSVTRSERY